jgi:hypothetical protein
MDPSGWIGRFEEARVEEVLPLAVSRFGVPLEMSDEPSWFFFTTWGE